MKIDILPISSIAKDSKVLKIYKNIGDKINKNEALFDLEGQKSAVTITSKSNGIILNINVEIGSLVDKNTVLAVIDEAAEKEEKKAAPMIGFDYFSNISKPKDEHIETDITIIGGGPGGYVAAIYAAKLGAKVTLIEKEKLGGTCLNWGCIPTKTLVRSAEVYKNMKNAEDFGLYAENIKIDMEKIISRKNSVVSTLVGGIENLIKQNRINLINGTGKIEDKNTVIVTSKNKTTVSTKNIIIATGSANSKLPIEGIDLENVIDSKAALDLESLPKKLVIIGGGVIGMEFANIYNSFGCNVSVVEFFDKCLLSCDTDVIELSQKTSLEKGINLYTGSKVEKIKQSQDKELIVEFSKDGETKYITADKVLVAVGRTPYFKDLSNEELNLELNDKNRGIKVNDKMQTNIPNIYAIGDVTNKLLLAHVASHQGIVAVKNIMGIPCEMDYTAVPSAIFTDPEIAMVGMSEKMAKEKNLNIKIGTFPFGANGKALSAGETEGFIKLIEDVSSNKIIGSSIVGLHATDLIGEITLAIKNNLSKEDIIETIHPHPTTCEVIHEAALALDKGSIHFFN
ncbi:MAG: dihydrolipoyl dehydrogenase [Clostridiaceae bacterium]